MSDRAFSIQRGVGNKTRDADLSFVRNLGGIAEGMGVKLFAELGMSAVELVRRNEIESIQAEYPQFEGKGFRKVLQKYKKEVFAELDDYCEVELVGTDLIEVGDGNTWVGGMLSTSSNDAMARERMLLGAVIGAAVGENIDLPIIDHFLNIGIVDRGKEMTDPLLDYVANKLPDRIMVFDVGIG